MAVAAADEWLELGDLPETAEPGLDQPGLVQPPLASQNDAALTELMGMMGGVRHG